MASPAENMTAMDPWTFRPGFADSWISEAFARDTETLTRALQKSISNSFSNFDSFDVGHKLNLIDPPTTTTLSASTVSGSDLETAPKRRRTTNPNPSPTGKISKRKSRSTKRSQTTFITADPANFRQMVQQVTGVGFSNGNLCSSLTPILKPEPQRPVNRLQNGAAGSGCLPTLDTSAFLLDHQQASAAGGMGVGSSSLPFHSPVVTEAAFSTGANLDSFSFSSFPTLESWKA